MRLTQFTNDAQSVQGNPGATVTFKCLTGNEIDAAIKMQELPEEERKGEPDFLTRVLVDWHGIEGANGQMLPSPKDDPSVINALYPHEQKWIQDLFWAGPDKSPKN